ncbi:MAG: DUF262 domain-containing protein [Erysipelotrichaceae bacterium]|nr:DUF262 domain-containing protein [Erysipelotrichaceae bacterium]
MKANASNILRFMAGTDKKFIIPVYQRPYSWKKDNCSQLLKDLKDVYNFNYSSHFFGSIVFVSNNNGVCEEHTIIDGQQRITTVSLLLLALRNYVIEHPDKKININPDKITGAYLTDEYSNNEKKLKLKLVQGDDEAYDNLIENKIPIENTSITANYNYFYKEIINMSECEIEGLYNAVTKLEIVSISLEPQSGDDPQLIFESLNSTGLDLESADKIRNFVLMRMDANEQERFYKKYWEPLEKTVSRNEMNRFIRYYLAVKTRKLSNEKKLYFEFKYYKETTKKSIETIILEMLEFADYFKIIENPKESHKPYSDILSRINKLEVKTCVPLLMDLFKANVDGYISETEMILSFEIIENYIARREICDLPANALNKVFVQLGAEIDRDIEDENMTYYDAFKYEIMKKSGRSRFPNDHDFEDKFMVYDLYNAKSSIKKYMLERLENYGNKEIVAVEELINNGTLTIEHIMPQTLTNEWKSMLGDNWELTHSKYKDTIGNLTLTGYNSDYSNSSFNAKKTMPNKGFNYSKLYLNEYIQQCEVWNENEILNRARCLFNKAISIWWIPDISSQLNTDNDIWMTWDDDIDVTNKKISQVIFLDSVIKTNDITAAFKIVHERIFYLDPTVYYNGNYYWFGENSEKLRRGYKIGDNAYIETNLSSQDKLATIRTIARICRFESDDIKFLVQEKSNKPKFDISNEETYQYTPVGQLAFSFFDDLIEKNVISESEMELLKTKEYAAKLFSRIEYPIISDNRDANKGNGKVYKYRKKSLIFKGKEIFITTQWSETNRHEIIDWYKNHL